MDIAATMVEHHVWLVGELIDRAEQHERMLEELAEPPGSFLGDQTVRTALYLLVTDLERWVDTVDGVDPAATDPIAAPADLRKRHTVAGARFLELVRQVVAEDRADDRFRDGGRGVQLRRHGGAYCRAIAIGALTATEVVDLRNGDPMPFFVG
jgi:AraC family transcriptional regulator